MLINFLNVMVAIVCIVILKIYFSIFFEKKKDKANKYLLWGIYFIWQAGVITYSGFPIYVKVAIGTLFILAISINYYNGDLWFKFVASMLMSTIWTTFEYFVGALFILVGPEFEILRISGAFFSQSFTLFMIVILKKYFKSKTMRHLPTFHYILMLLVPLGGIYLGYNIFYLASILKTSQAIKMSIAGSVIILILNIVIFKIYLLLGKQSELEKDNISYSQQLVAFEKHHRDREQLYDDFRRVRHDYKQHLSVLREFLKKEEYSQMKIYLDDMIENRNAEDSFIVSTNNLVVDSLINSKLAVLTGRGIELVTDIHVPVQLSFASGDIGILLGNIIDNAVEAVGRDASSNKFIKLFIKFETNMLLITCLNTYSGELKKTNRGEIVTSKEDSYHHGFGLSSIRKVADKYHGSVIIEDAEGIFKIKVVMYA